MVGSNQHLITGGQPLGQIARQRTVGAACRIAVLRRREAEAVPGVVDVHRMDQQKVRLMTQAQAFGVVEQMAVGIAVVVIEMPVLDRQLRRVGMAVARGVERRAVIQFAEPVISGGGGGQPAARA